LKKIFKKYTEWLFANNRLTLKPQNSQDHLVFEGRSTAFISLIANSVVNILIILLILFLSFHFKVNHPLFIILVVIIVLVFGIAFCVGLIATAHQPFWRHRNKISFTPEGIFTINGIYFQANTKSQRLKHLKVRIEMVDRQVAHVQFWRNGRKEAFINAFLVNVPQTMDVFFDWFRTYALHWGLTYYDISPSKNQNIEVFEFARQGKNALDQHTQFSQLKQKALDNQSRIGPTLEIIANYALQATPKGILITRRPGFKFRSWLFFISVFFGAGGFLLLLTLNISQDTNSTKDLMNTYGMMSLFLLVWIGLLIWSLSNLLSDFQVRIDAHQLYFQRRKNKGFTFNQGNIQSITIQGKIHRGKMTILSGIILVKLKEEKMIQNKPLQEFHLLEVSSGHPNNIDTKFVRDAVYDRSMRIARVIAQTLGVEIVWKGFEQ